MKRRIRSLGILLVVSSLQVAQAQPQHPPLPQAPPRPGPIRAQPKAVTTAELTATGLRVSFQPRNVVAGELTATGLRVPFQPKSVTTDGLSATGLRQ